MSGDSWHIVWTLLLMAAFIGIVAWAWSRKRQQDFKEAAQLPLEEDDRGAHSTRENGESR
ncbi:cbb3-type cytochrome c oxidase subunit 3 [Thioalkalivibrio sp. XN8]|uniref:cbb3-type cytochrome oxidase subunit 3 n=1 Tax=Thioalkalivibrio sp. XN8 TaxID=2712863 RepID=UPI0013EE30DD|nr:cbb3-type cytochrome c oxidase subunit 3 [Thioalkalivibrio sp. XN8]NGP54232.1 cbb3-type cytochrome c oxidase subunit 3 [Thioalkalivibrio sp. XN8]